MKRMYIIAGLFVLAIGAGLFRFREMYQTTPPHPLCPDCSVVFIAVDTLRSDGIPDTMKTFARQNIAFTNAYSTSSWTLPSMFSVWTSLYPSSHGMNGSLNEVLSDRITTLPSFFQNAGYHTVFVGPTDNPDVPLAGGIGRGFDSVIDSQTIDDWNNAIRTATTGSSSGKPTFLFLLTFDTHGSWKQSKAFQQARMFSDQKLRDITTYLRTNIPTSLEEKKHNDELLSRLDAAPTRTAAQSVFEKLTPQEEDAYTSLEFLLHVNPSDPDQMTAFRQSYDQAVSSMGTKLDSVIDGLEKGPLGGKTVFVITALHGDEFGEHGIFAHDNPNLYNTTTKIPFILKIPGVTPRTTDVPVSLIDIAPTLLSVTGIQAKMARPDGVPLTDVIRGETIQNPNRLILSQHLFSRPSVSIRSGVWHLYVDLKQNNSLALFHTADDPDEKNSVLDMNKEQAEELKSMYARYIQSLTVYKPYVIRVANDYQQKLRLQKEGYFRDYRVNAP